MNRIPEREPSFSRELGTYVCNRFALHPIIFDKDFHMETAFEQIDIEESDYSAKPHSRFYFYSRLLNIINFQNQFLFPTRVYTYPLRNTASVHMLTAEELLDRPTLAIEVELVDEELLNTPIFGLNMAKLPPSTDVLAPPAITPTADFRATTAQINDFLKLTLNDIRTLAPVPMHESMLVQPTAMDAKTNTTTDQTLTNIAEETTANQSTTMDVPPQEPPAVVVPPATAMDSCISLGTPAVLPGGPMMATVAATRYIAPVRFSQQIISDAQWQALAAALTTYHFLWPPPGMLFPEHHWMDYLDALKEEIQGILLPQPMPAPPVPQIAQLAPRPNSCHAKTPQAVIAANRKATMMHCRTTLKVNKCVRCILPAFTKVCINTVSATHH
uniref:Uncharacterized protein n=1 Tax=Romanomermis culicivorax TaxID=13658 RepID=A0A915IPV6_ROMCU